MRKEITQFGSTFSLFANKLFTLISKIYLTELHKKNKINFLGWNGTEWMNDFLALKGKIKVLKL